MTPPNIPQLPSNDNNIDDDNDHNVDNNDEVKSSSEKVNSEHAENMEDMNKVPLIARQDPSLALTTSPCPSLNNGGALECIIYSVVGCLGFKVAR